MSDKALALSAILPASPADPDYDAICATVMASERGRRFLEEYARRNRTADTHVLLDAIGRIEGVVRDERTRHADLALRTDLLDMAKAIAQTRAEVTETGGGAVLAAAGTDPPCNVFAAAERLKEVAWTMRERGLDFATCGQIEELAATILSAATLRDPRDRRAQKLAEVLAHLEARIGGMIEAHAPATPPESRAYSPDIEAELFVASTAGTADGEVTGDKADPADLTGEATTDFAQVEAATPLPAPAGMSEEGRIDETGLPETLRPELPIPAPAAPQTSSTGLAPLSDPLTALRALSEAERIALFT